MAVPADSLLCAIHRRAILMADELAAELHDDQSFRVRVLCECAQSLLAAFAGECLVWQFSSGSMISLTRCCFIPELNNSHSQRELE